MLCFHVEMGSFFVAADVFVVVVVLLLLDVIVIVVDIACDCCSCCCFVSVFAYHLAQQLSFSLSILYYDARLMWRSTMDFLSSSLSMHIVFKYVYAIRMDL